MLGGFNCTIFAYGQTGTGKTYTMSGDISPVVPIPDAAGIVPRVLHTLFARLEAESEDGNAQSENSVKCSFIELYNEELRDLLSPDDSTKLKIYDDANKNGRTTTQVQGMEETHIKSANKGIQLLREGSHKRQVAATKCNDLSSRSHTVFTVTVYTKRTSDTGEDYVSAGKLNLVDLAGSENIQRSGAENKRAAEAGLINKSLLTLGRVINALVEKSSHIPYRESKLTRLLQDSLGGRTKTCIIATLSPAKSNLEETISTLDYAFRAKNIRNKPQVNQMVSKKTLLREFTAEIEKLKSELIATRQRNGVYLTGEAYEEITTESESRRILSEEQRDRIETMESNLRNKVQELFVLTSNFQGLKKDNESTRMMLDGTKSLLEKTEVVLSHTKRSLSEETYLREAHQETEGKLVGVGGELLSTLSTTTDHVERLHDKLRRRSELHSLNKCKWTDSQSHVLDTTSSIDDRIEILRGQQEELLAGLSGRMQSFVQDEMRELLSSQSLLKEKSAAFGKSEAEVTAQTSRSEEELNVVLDEICTLREDVKAKVGTGLEDLSGAAKKISQGIAIELEAFHSQLQDSYVSLGREFKGLFDGMIKKMNEQQTEAEKLRRQITDASSGFVTAGQASQAQLQAAVEEERQAAASERATLMEQITTLINNTASRQESRMADHLEAASKRQKTSESSYLEAQQAYGSDMDSWNASSQALIDSSVKSRDTIKSKLKADWTAANEHTTRITDTTNAVHSETVRIVDGQMSQMDSQLLALDEIVSRVKAQNESHHEAHTNSLSKLALDVQQSYASIGGAFETSYSRTQTLDEEMRERVAAIEQTLPELSSESDIRMALQLLRDGVQTSQLAEYQTTGQTPARQQYAYPNALPRTEAHENLLARLRGEPPPNQAQNALPMKSPKKSPTKRSSATKIRGSPTKIPASPSKARVFADSPPVLNLQPSQNSAPASRPVSKNGELRELDANAMPMVETPPVVETDASAKAVVPSLKRLKTDPLAQSVGPESKLPTKRKAASDRGSGEKENQMLSASVGPGGAGGGRRLRSRGSD